MTSLINRNSPFFDEKEAKRLFEENKNNLDDVNGWEVISGRDTFWNVYDKGVYVGSVFAYEAEDNNYYMGGYAMRKKHKQVVDAIKAVAQCFNVIYAHTRHKNAALSLRKAGFKWFNKQQGILIGGLKV